MIRNENECQAALQRLTDEQSMLKKQHSELKQMDLSKEEIKRAIDPLRSFHEQLQEEVASYERLRRGEFDELTNFEGIGRMLIAIRVAQGLSQRELSERLDVHESAVSRDERNEYHGITVERVSRILSALGATIHTTVDTGVSPQPPSKQSLRYA